MLKHANTSDEELRSLIRNRIVSVGGNLQLKIYGKLSCASGKRMKRKHRVFFHSIDEALDTGFRPCGHCMSAEYKIWKGDCARTIHVGRKAICNHGD